MAAATTSTVVASGSATASSHRHRYHTARLGCAPHTAHLTPRTSQAQDRNFEGVFLRCKTAATSIADVAPAMCRAEHKELQTLGEPSPGARPPNRLLMARAMGAQC